MDVEHTVSSFRFSHRNRGMWCVKSLLLSHVSRAAYTLAMNTGRIHRAFSFCSFIHS